MKIRKQTIARFLALAGAAALFRIGQFIPNVSPVTAIALYAGATLPIKWALLVPVAAMLASDLVIGFDHPLIVLSVYGSFALAVIFGRGLRTAKSAPMVVMVSTLASSAFFLITNAAVWLFSGMYEASITGLIYSYYYAIPFYRNTLAGDLIFTAGVFTAAHLLPIVLHRLHGSRFSSAISRLEGRFFKKEPS